MRFLAFFVVVVLYSCGSREAKETVVDPWATEVLVQPKSCADFLNRFKDFSSDTFKIVSPEQDDDLNDDVFFGTELDSTYYSFIDKNVAEYTQGMYKIFACFKRKVSPGKYLILLRTPGEYWESKIKLYVFDSLLQRNIASLEVAENWGDAGDSMSKISYLLFKQGACSLVLFKNESYSTDDEYKDFTSTDSVFFYNINEGISFVKGGLYDSTATYNHLFK
ncbi:MAG: hypothetical protein NT150_15515 [Bacteroidetes bacterium]|nr:hypothetical protein [Bacteroidota bacterium]